MNNILKKSLIYVLVASMVLVPLAGTVMAEEAVLKEEISGERMMADFFFTRPVGLISMITGTFLFLFSLPFQFSEDNRAENEEEVIKNVNKLVIDPTKYTFQRRLGDI